MATTKRGKKARAAARKSTATRGKSAPGRKGASAKGSTKAGKRPAAKAAKKAGAKAAAGGGAALAQQKARFDRERNDLQKRLTDMVREIGELRHHEMRATQLARQVAERDQTIAGLRRELSEARSRPVVAHADQANLDFGSEEIRVDDLEESVPLDDEDDDLM